ncbi:MAG TPA: cytochrome c [Bacteroidota bacterium]|nr:cytochrome c [Bacteroidota bacterium]
MAKDKPQPGEPEFRDTDDVHVNTIHQRIVAREQEEPEEGFEPPPWWVWTISVLLLFAMGFYLGRYSGSWTTIAHEVEQPQLAQTTPLKKEVKGDLVYVGVCQTCHQPNGLGVAGQYPPLVGSEWLLEDIETPVRIVLYGLEGPITVRGSTYNNKMPPFHDKLSDEEIAAVLTHARASWGNAAPAVKPEDVAALRTKYGVRPPWTSSELVRVRMTQK